MKLEEEGKPLTLAVAKSGLTKQAISDLQMPKMDPNMNVMPETIMILSRTRNR